MNSLIRNSAKAIIVRDGCVLLVRINDEDGEWYVLPGGGQTHGESLRETLQRECLEEICVPVQVGELRLVREYIAKNHDADECDWHVHRVEFMFECQIAADAVPSNGVKPDARQTGIVWVPVAGHRGVPALPNRTRPDSSRRSFQSGLRLHGGHGVVGSINKKAEISHPHIGFAGEPELFRWPDAF